MVSPPPGWYNDPARSDRLRYWDGASWTEHLSDPAQLAKTQDRERAAAAASGRRASQRDADRLSAQDEGPRSEGGRDSASDQPRYEEQQRAGSEGSGESPSFWPFGPDGAQQTRPLQQVPPSTVALPPTSASPQSVPPTSAPPQSVPPTSAPPQSVPPTSVPPTSAPPTSAPPASTPPTSAPPPAHPRAPEAVPPARTTPLIDFPPDQGSRPKPTRGWSGRAPFGRAERAAGTFRASQPVTGPVAKDGTPLARWWRRLLAWALDVALVVGVSIIPSLLILATRIDELKSYTRAVESASGRDGGFPTAPAGLLGAVTACLVLGTLIYFLYEVFGLSRYGTTIGRRTLGIRVRVPGTPGHLSLDAASRRAGVKVAGQIATGVPVLANLGLFFTLMDFGRGAMDRDRRTLHDLAGGTDVVLVDGPAPRLPVQGGQPPYGQGGQPPYGQGGQPPSERTRDTPST